VEKVETTDTTVRVLGPPKFDRHGNHEIPVEDADGRLSDLRVWSKHHGQVEWRVGSTYELEGVKRNPVEANKARYETSVNTQISRVGHPQTPEVSLLHVSDTHLGRPLTDKEHMGNANQLERILDAVNLAVTSRVDAILLTGDIFDDDIAEATIQIVEEHVELLADAGIPVYYVRGHHGCDRGDAFLRSQTEAGRMIHLSNEPQLLGEGTLALYGMDANASADGLSEVAPTGDAPRDAYRMLAWHKAVEPIARDGISIGQLVDASEVELDALALGDLHKNKRAYIGDVYKDSGEWLRAFYAGATTGIARNSEGYAPAAWLLQITDGTLERYRLPLRPQ
jgi:exonuclease SbcD